MDLGKSAVNGSNFAVELGKPAAELGKIIYVTGGPEDPDDLRKSFYTKRKKGVIEFSFGDSGKTAWFAVQIENDGRKGPWDLWFLPSFRNKGMSRIERLHIQIFVGGVKTAKE
jgi:hypothetical protein